MARHTTEDTIGKKSRWVLLKLVSLPGIVHRSLALFISVLLLSETVAATPKQFSPLKKGGWGRSSSLAQQPAATEQDATHVAAERTFEEGDQLYQQGTAESLRQAIARWEEALSLYRATDDKKGEAVTLNNIGGVYDDLGNKQTALDYYNQSLPLMRQAGDKAGEAVTLNNIGRVYSDLGEKQTALDYYNQSLPLTRQVGDKAGEAVTLNNIGAVYSALGDKQTALDYFNQSLPLTRQVGDKAGEAITLNNIGAVYSDLGDKQTALDYFNQSLPLKRQVGDKAGEAATLNNIGGVYDDLGNKQTALDYFNQSLPLKRQVGDKAGEAVTLNNIGRVYSDLGDKQTALDYFNQSLPLMRQVGDKAGEAVTLTNIGVIYSDLGEKQTALDYYNQSLPLRRQVGDKAGEAVTLTNIGAVYSDLGDKQTALDYYNQSLPLMRQVGDKAGEAATLNSIGAVYSALGEKQTALDYYNRSLPLRRQVGDKAGEADTLNSIGAVYSALGDKQTALDYLNQSLPLMRQVGDKAGEAVTLGNVAYLERNRGNLNSALTQMEAAINIIEDLRTKIASQQLRASYFASQQVYYEFYINLLMQLHKTNPDKGYDALALNASERARARNLLEILTEANADIRRGADPNLVQQERTLQQQLNAQEYRQYQLRQGQYTNKELADIQNDIKSLLSQLNDVQARLRVKSPSYAALTQPQAFTLNLQQIQQQVLDDNTLLLEYFLGKDRSYLWAVTKTGITSYELPKGTDIEAAAKDFYSQLQSEAASNPEVGMKLSQMLLAPVASQLGQKRLVIVSDGALQSIPFAALPIPSTAGGVGGEVQQGKNTALPTAALTPTSALANSSPTSPASPGSSASSTPLLVQHEIVSLPSASTLAVLRREVKDRPPAAKTLAVLANPVFSRDDQRFKTPQQPRQNTTVPTADPLRSSSIGEATETYDPLPNTLTEAQQILQFVPNPTQSLQAIGFAASRATATSPELAQYRMIHFATHGSANGEHPELSKVVLSLVDEKGADIDGFLHLQDIFNLNLPAELVVLSACQTGLGKDVKGEGLMGLTRGFMYAGSKRVVVSLWRVKDSSTASLMTNFYQQMLQQGLNPVAALRAAQLKMLQSEQWKSPYYWAPFVIQGEWR